MQQFYHNARNDTEAGFTLLANLVECIDEKNYSFLGYFQQILLLNSYSIIVQCNVPHLNSVYNVFSTITKKEFSAKNKIFRNKTSKLEYYQ